MRAQIRQDTCLCVPGDVVFQDLIGLIHIQLRVGVTVRREHAQEQVTDVPSEARDSKEH